MNDLISRQAAIDALAKEMPSLTTPDGSGEFDHDIQIADEAFVDCMQIINELPTVQPEPIKINIDDFNKEDLERFKKEFGNTPITVLPAQPEIIRCKDCKYRDENWRRVSVRWLPCMEVLTGSNWYCGSAERKEE